MDTIRFSELSQAERQAIADVWLHERARHVDDILKIDENLGEMFLYFGISPREVFVDKWIEIDKIKPGY